MSMRYDLHSREVWEEYYARFDEDAPDETDPREIGGMQEVKLSKAQEAAETVEAIENAIQALEDAQEYELETLGLSRDRNRRLFWEPLGDGGSALLGLKLILRRLRERGN